MRTVPWLFAAGRNSILQIAGECRLQCVKKRQFLQKVSKLGGPGRETIGKLLKNPIRGALEIFKFFFISNLPQHSLVVGSTYLQQGGFPLFTKLRDPGLGIRKSAAESGPGWLDRASRGWAGSGQAGPEK